MVADLDFDPNIKIRQWSILRWSDGDDIQYIQRTVRYEAEALAQHTTVRADSRQGTCHVSPWHVTGMLQ